MQKLVPGRRPAIYIPGQTIHAYILKYWYLVRLINLPGLRSIGEEFDHMTRHVWPLFKVKGQRPRSQGHVTYQQQARKNAATNSHINFKLGGNYHRVGSSLMLVEIWWSQLRSMQLTSTRLVVHWYRSLLMTPRAFHAHYAIVERCIYKTMQVAE